MVSKSLKKVLLFISFFYIFISSKTLVANEWLIGDVGVFQGLDKITARIKTFKIKVGVSKKFGILNINLRKCVYSKPLDEPEFDTKIPSLLDRGFRQKSAADYESWTPRK